MAAQKDPDQLATPQFGDWYDEKIKSLTQERDTLRAENERLKAALREIATGTKAWERDEMIDCAEAALMSQSSK